MMQKYNQIIYYPSSITLLAIQPEGLLIQGSKGIAFLKINPKLKIQHSSLCLHVNTHSLYKPFVLTFAAEFEKIIYSVNNGFFCKITLDGLAYKVEKIQNYLIFWLGLSHTIKYKIPETTKIELESPRTFCIYGVDAKEVTLISDQIMRLKKKEIYKSKGFILHENPKKSWYSSINPVKLLKKKK